MTQHSIKKKAKAKAHLTPAHCNSLGAAPHPACGHLLPSAEKDFSRPTGEGQTTAEVSIPTPLTLTRKEFAAAFRLSLRTVERMIAAREIRICHIGPKAVRIPRSEAERYLQGKS